MYYVYVLQSLADRQFYTGSTSNVKERIKRHNSGFVTSTKDRVPMRLIYCEICINKQDALHREVYLKTAWGKKYLKNRLRHYLIENPS